MRGTQSPKIIKQVTPIVNSKNFKVEPAEPKLRE